MTTYGTVAVLSKLYKTQHADLDRQAKMLYTNNPVLEFVVKDQTGTGESLTQPVLYGRPQGVGPTRAVAQAAATTEQSHIKAEKWVMTWGEYKASHYISDRAINLSRGNEGAFLRIQDEGIDQLMQQIGRENEILLCGGSGHHRGTFTESSGVCTCTNKYDAAMYPLGAMIQASADDGSSTSHALLGSGSYGYVIACDPNAGTFTVSATDGGSAGTPSGWTGTMYGFRAGEFGGTATPNVIYKGVGSWLPLTAPTTGDSHYNVDRSVSVVELSGCRLTSTDVANMAIDDIIQESATQLSTIGTPVPGELQGFLNPVKWLALSRRLAQQGYRDLERGKTKFGASTITVETPLGPLPIASAPVWPLHEFRILNKATCKLHSAGKYPRLLDGDMLQRTRVADADVYETRYTGDVTFCIRGPGANSVAYIP